MFDELRALLSRAPRRRVYCDGILAIGCSEQGGSPCFIAVDAAAQL